MVGRISVSFFSKHEVLQVFCHMARLAASCFLVEPQLTPIKNLLWSAFPKGNIEVIQESNSRSLVHEFYVIFDTSYMSYVMLGFDRGINAALMRTQATQSRFKTYSHHSVASSRKTISRLFTLPGGLKNFWK